MPLEDEPGVVAAFEAVLAEDTNDFQPPDVAESDGLGFSKGGDRASLRLLPEDEQLIRAVAAVNPNTVVALVAGSAVLMDSWSDQVPAIVQSWYAGMEGGHALTDLLLGAIEPSGRLPFSVPTDVDHLPLFDAEAHDVVYDGWHGYWKLAREGHAPAHPFGFGLSYTELALTEIEIALEPGGTNDTPTSIVVGATCANTGDRPGIEVVQVYVAAEGGPSRLRGFARVEVPAGSRRRTEVRIPVSSLARRTTNDTWDPASGEVDVTVARHAGDPEAVEATIIVD
jgi:beta-glucosidase